VNGEREREEEEAVVETGGGGEGKKKKVPKRTDRRLRGKRTQREVSETLQSKEELENWGETLVGKLN